MNRLYHSCTVSRLLFRPSVESAAGTDDAAKTTSFASSTHSCTPNRCASPLSRLRPPFTVSLRAGGARDCIKQVCPCCAFSDQLSAQRRRSRSRKQKARLQAKARPASEGGRRCRRLSFYVNGKRNSVDIIDKAVSSALEKLLNIAILEAISAQNGKVAVPNKADVDVA